ncbi:MULTISPECIES: DUF3854 domain-containing protein [unclassified Microcoleus]|uniref:DUF3854 domain-containing protein n=1 Tax=unclassified Microcoleus TaxID=2642155 RepID=UPI002FD1025E
MNSSYPNGSNSASQNSTFISPKHLAEWVEGSAVSEAIARLNIESLTAKELNERIQPKEPIKTGGWWCRSINWRTGVKTGNRYGQGKPDKPHQPEGQKPRKYLTASGTEPDAIFLAMPDRDYWFKTRNDLSVPRHWTEGVKKAGSGLSIGLATIALTGVWNWGKDGQLAKEVENWVQPETVHYIDFDSDYAGNSSCRAAILKLGRLLEERGCEVYITTWDAQFKGMDDFIKANGGDAFKEAVANAPTLDKWEKQLKKSDRKKAALTPNKFLTSHAHTREDVVCQKYDSSANDYIPDIATPPELSYVQKAEASLYSEGHWVSIAGQIYQFADGYYQLRSEPSEKRRIRDWLSTYFENVKGVYRCNRASSASINQVYDWVVAGLAVEIDAVNPPGLNCSNGVLRINPDGSHTFAPHNPKQVYTYIGGKYDSSISPVDCDRLLECLEPQQREIFLRTVAAALCLPLARLKMSRVKGLLCHGDGSNGKDTLRTALVAVLGRGVTGKSLKDFQVYDSGRKFPLAGLENSLCNWSSENADAVKLDKLQSLKQFITGDELTIEHKGRGEYPYKPEAIFLANCNVLPSISSDAEAIRSRYCILSFKKTYAVGADSGKGQLEADPRFKEDPNFILERIAPALLNRMLERIPLLLAEGINYGSSDAALREAQEKSQHLWQFVRDMGYEAGQGERVYAKDLWQELRDWYVEAGILEIEGEKEKLVWNELPGRDTPVKAINQVFARFSELFPRLQKHRHTERGFESQRMMGEAYYLGICKQNSKISKKSSSASSALDSTVLSSSALLQQKNSAEDGAEAVTLTQRAAEDAEDENSLLLELCNSLSKLTLSQRQKLTKLTGIPCSDPIKAFRLGDEVAGNNPEDISYNWHGRIVEIHTSIGCKVDWQERDGMKGGRVISMLFCNLRKI